MPVKTFKHSPRLPVNPFPWWDFPNSIWLWTLLEALVLQDRRALCSRPHAHIRRTKAAANNMLLLSQWSSRLFRAKHFNAIRDCRICPPTRSMVVSAASSRLIWCFAVNPIIIHHTQHALLHGTHVVLWQTETWSWSDAVISRPL